jgi:drug/metabolite transporter (DMT)-like permease
MALAGIAWGLYSIRGRGALDPLASTTTNFVYAVPMALVVSFAAFGSLHVTPKGALLAVLSGALASGCGYVVWYAALRYLTAMRAATVQLSVPVLTTIGGALFLSESVTAGLVISSIMILGGIAVVLASREQARR